MAHGEITSPSIRASTGPPYASKVTRSRNGMDIIRGGRAGTAPELEPHGGGLFLSKIYPSLVFRGIHTDVIVASNRHPPTLFYQCLLPWPLISPTRR